MVELLAILVPVFGLIGIGYAARALGLLGPRAGEGLSEFVFVCAIPTLIFRTMAQAKLPEAQPWGFWLAYFAALALVWALVAPLAARFFGQNRPSSVIAGFAAAQSNTVMVGIPLILRAYGEEGAAPLFLLIAVHLPVMLVVAAIAIEGAGGLDPRDLARRLALNPILIGLFAGLAWRWTGWSLAGPPKQLVDSLSAAAAPCALVAMGLTIRQVGWPAERGLLAILVGCKLLLHPALCWVMAMHVFAMPPVWASVAVLFAAMPTGVNAYLLAERHRAGVALTSSSVAVTTALSPLSIGLWLWLLGAAR